MVDDVLAEGGALDFGGTFHETGEVIGDLAAADGAVEALDDEIGGFGPA